jgi:hypothetical protein
VVIGDVYVVRGLHFWVAANTLVTNFQELCSSLLQVVSKIRENSKKREGTTHVDGLIGYQQSHGMGAVLLQGNLRDSLENSILLYINFHQRKMRVFCFCGIVFYKYYYFRTYDYSIGREKAIRPKRSCNSLVIHNILFKMGSPV